MAHIVTCQYCKKKFDRDKFPFIQISQRRYAHKECGEEQEKVLKQNEKDKQELYNYLNVLFKGDYNYALVNKNIKKYIEEFNYTYSGIKKALVYFYEIKGNSLEKANKNIGIVPFVYQDAFNYYYSIWLANQTNEIKLSEDNLIIEEKIVHIPPPKRKIKKRKLFSFLDEEENE